MEERCEWPFNFLVANGWPRAFQQRFRKSVGEQRIRREAKKIGKNTGRQRVLGLSKQGIRWYSYTQKDLRSGSSGCRSRNGGGQSKPSGERNFLNVRTLKRDGKMGQRWVFSAFRLALGGTGSRTARDRKPRL